MKRAGVGERAYAVKAIALISQDERGCLSPFMKKDVFHGGRATLRRRPPRSPIATAYEEIHPLVSPLFARRVLAGEEAWRDTCLLAVFYLPADEIWIDGTHGVGITSSRLNTTRNSVNIRPVMCNSVKRCLVLASGPTDNRAARFTSSLPLANRHGRIQAKPSLKQIHLAASAADRCSQLPCHSPSETGRRPHCVYSTSA
ncbi:hypothetical protein EYF80_033197 [Liparis tanakae]|uniref:Uncharacterized protein n=1 Tax=Liparis tanakae TaxID=230148 RepID=A0A4Z2GUY5_9TELE|nr:hypothetical protein EYF80_033197 [Liparis tanakae]